MGLKMGGPGIELSTLSVTDISYISKIKPQGKICSCNVTDIILEPPIDFWNIGTQFIRAGRYTLQIYPKLNSLIKKIKKEKKNVNHHC